MANYDKSLDRMMYLMNYDNSVNELKRLIQVLNTTELVLMVRNMASSKKALSTILKLAHQKNKI